MDKGQTLIIKLGKKFKSEDKKCVKIEEMTKPLKRDIDSQQPSIDSKGKGLLIIEKETQLVQIKVPAEAIIDEKIVVTEKVAVKEEDAKVQPRIPITVLSED